MSPETQRAILAALARLIARKARQQKQAAAKA
jgi:predicted Fe-S protein YdhL (DUF1289 family)